MEHRSAVVLGTSAVAVLPIVTDARDSGIPQLFRDCGAVLVSLSSIEAADVERYQSALLNALGDLPGPAGLLASTQAMVSRGVQRQ